MGPRSPRRTHDASTARPREAVLLDAPAVEFGEDFDGRLEALVRRACALAASPSGAGRGAFPAVGGPEFHGFRSYRSGEDVRHLDWGLLARLDRPYVRVSRREMGEAWTVLVDTSASMGFGAAGSHGKLQLTAEVALGLALFGLHSGATVRLEATGDVGAETILRRPPDWVRGRAFLGSLRAAGPLGLGARFKERIHERGRLFALGDFFDATPADWLRQGGAGRELGGARILAPEELDPAGSIPRVESLLLIDPESGESVRTSLAAAPSYVGALTDELESWRAATARHRIRFGVWRSDAAFEEVVRQLVP